MLNQLVDFALWQEVSQVHASISTPENAWKSIDSGGQDEKESAVILDSDKDSIVGMADKSDLEVLLLVRSIDIFQIRLIIL